MSALELLGVTFQCFLCLFLDDPLSPRNAEDPGCSERQHGDSYEPPSKYSDSRELYNDAASVASGIRFLRPSVPCQTHPGSSTEYRTCRV